MGSFFDTKDFDMNLVDFAQQYFDSHEFGIKENSQRCYYMPAARQFVEATNCTDVAAINKGYANQYVDWLRSRPISVTTQHTRRRAFATLWRAAYDAGQCPVFEPFRRIRLTKKSPRAWSREDVEKLFDVTVRDQSEWAWGMKTGTYWGSLFSAAWDSGLRLGDLLSLELDWLIRDRKSGTAVVVMSASKTGKEHVVTFNPPTMRLIDCSLKEHPHRKLIWPLRNERREFYRDVKKRLAAAGLDGSFRYLRRSAVTYAESISPGMGTRLAGHRDSRTTRESYIDPLLLPDNRVILPALKVEE